MKKCNITNLRKIFSWVAVIFWMALIFYLSHQPAIKSNDLSTGLTEMIIKTVERIAPDLEFDLGSFNHIIRKNAHFFAYLILGILVINTQRCGDVHRYRKIILALAICILYAISDEVHQLFVLGRGGQIRDALIDSAGAAVGILGYLGMGKIKKGHNENSYIL